MKNDGLNGDQMSAIRRGLNLGRALQKDHPEISTMYKDHTLPEISDRLSVSSKYGINETIAVIAVYNALRGHYEDFGVSPYEGLLSKEEINRIGKEHQRNNGRKTRDEKIGIFGRTNDERLEDCKKGGYKMGGIRGQETYETGVGIYARTPEQHSDDSVIGGNKSYEEKLGVHGMSAEQRVEAGRKSAASRGQISWTDGEIEHAYKLSLTSEYMHQSGRHNGRACNELIALELNKQFHDSEAVRTEDTVYKSLYRHKKSLESKVE